LLEYLPELIYRENFWLPQSFRTVLHAHKAHEIELIRDQFLAHRSAKQGVHQILEMGLLFGARERFFNYSSTKSGLIWSRKYSAHFGFT
jgi:hypothetical protein